MKLPEDLTLDYKKWICGQPDDNDSVKVNCHGKGYTKLLNERGFQCCLGQFIEQAGCKKLALRDKSYPRNIKSPIIGLNRKFSHSYTGFTDTKLSIKAAGINDNKDTTITEKVIQLRKLFASKGYTIHLKNFPKKILLMVESKS